jgi:hypothetical protein
MTHKQPEFIELKTYPSGRIELDMSLDQFSEFNQSCVAIEGLSITALAETDTRRTYQLIRKMIGGASINSTFNSVTINDIDVATNTSDGHETVASAARQVIQRIMPETIETTTEFSVGITPNLEDALLFGDYDERLSMIDIVVEPPDYAF